MEWDFSPADPKATMKVVSKIERVQPVMKGVDERGEIIWEGIDMPRWQQEAFRRAYHISEQEFGHFWDHMKNTGGQGGDFSTEKPTEPYWDIATPEKIQQWKKWAVMVREWKKKKGC